MERRGFIGGLLAMAGFGVTAKAASAVERPKRASLYVQEEAIVREYGLEVGDKIKYAVLEDGTFVSAGKAKLLLLMHKAGEGTMRVFTGKRVFGWGPYIQGRIAYRASDGGLTWGDSVRSRDGGEYLFVNDYAGLTDDADSRRVFGCNGDSGFTEIFPDENGVYWV